MFREVGNGMTTRMKRQKWSRWAGLGLAGALLLVLSGDGIGAGVSAHGIDPLDVLDLQVKPNVIIVLDSSGSMQETLYQNAAGAANNFSADWHESKMGLAKTVLTKVVTDNSSKASFLFGQYTQANSTMNNTGVAADRFSYVTYTDWNDATPNNGVLNVGETLAGPGGLGGLSPTMIPVCAAPWTTPCELSIRREPGLASGGSVTINAGNNLFQWRERITTASPFTLAQCSITLNSGTFTEPFAALIADFNAKAAAASYFPGSCTKYGAPTPISVTNPGNNYTLAWDAANRRFTLARGGSGRYAQLLFANANSVAPSLGFGNTNLPAAFVGPTPGVAPACPDCNATTFANTNWFNAFTLNGGGVTASRGFQAWQWITAAWNQFYFTEAGTNCTVTITPKFYARGQDLGNEIAAKMNACARPATANVYTVTYTTGTGRFTFGTNPANKAFTLRWTATPNNIGGALAAHTGTTGTPPNVTFTDAAVGIGGTWQTPNDSIRLLRRSLTDDAEDVDFDPDGTNGPLPVQDRTTFRLIAGKFFNGELLYVHGDGSLCGVDFASPVITSPPTVRLQQVSDCSNLSTTVGGIVNFEFAGGEYAGNNISCNGFQTNVKLTACDAASNVSLITALLEKEFPIDKVTGSPTFGQIKTYQERQNGSYAIQTLPAAGGIHADGSTPIANSLIGIRTVFGTSTTTGLWGAGQADDPLTVGINEARGPIRNQASPREKTIVMFVTDGDDTCANGGSGNDDNALRAAAKAKDLYTLVEATKAESSVTTYLIGFGTGASTNRLNWIAWGGSGLGQGLTGQPAVTTTGAGAAQRWDGTVETPTALQNKRNQCTTCVDAFVAPDADTLAAQLQSILDQGASSGEFTAQQAVFTPVMELVKEVTLPGPPVTNPFDPEAPNTRYGGSVPDLFRSSFTMPSFKGQLKAFQNDSGNVALKWNAGTKLYARVSTPLAACTDGASGECKFSTLLTRIDRRIYTTSRNGVFGATIGNLTDLVWLNGNGNRTNLWPASTAVAPVSDAATGILDAALGLPLTNDDPTFLQLQTTYQACLGAPLPASCTAAQPLKTQRARREAREMILAYMAGAKGAVAASLPKRVAGGDLLYVTRDWMLADSTLATPAVVGQPVPQGPTGSGFETEYKLYQDGFRNTDNEIVGDGTDIGFGLRNPDKDANHTTNGPATDVPNLKPAMTVLYVAANDMLHAFRAGPNCASPNPYELPPGTTNPPFSGFRYSACAETGGEELWGFVPFDQLGKLRQRLAVQTRSNHTYMLASSLRFGDIFVPNPGTAADRDGATTSLTIGSQTEALKGVWRRVLIFGRGLAGKSLTVLDITTPGDYKTLAKNTVPPVVYWNRGNIDTDDGTAAGTPNGTGTDQTAYARMGETWSVPTMAYVDRAAPGSGPGGLANSTTRKTSGIDFVLYAGSGYGDTSGCPGSPCEGQTFFTLDALTGDVIAAADIPPASGTPLGGYPNSLVANATAFNSNEYPRNPPPTAPDSTHPAAHKVSRVYIGDLHGRLWKFLSTDPGTPLLVTDLGIEQPIAAPVSLLGYDEGGTERIPYVYVNSGYDNRQDPNKTGEAFLIAGIRDDLDTALSPADACRQTPVVAPCVFARELVQDFGGITGYFRGSVQPATLLAATPYVGRVFFAGTRFNPPYPVGAPFAPPPCTGLGCNPVVPCRSSFDSIVYALGAKSGDAAFDLNATGDDSYVVFDNSKIAGLAIFATTDDAGTSTQNLYVDEGLNRDTGTPEGSKPRPETLPEKGKAPTKGGNGSVSTLELRSGSTVCQ